MINMKFKGNFDKLKHKKRVLEKFRENYEVLVSLPDTLEASIWMKFLKLSESDLKLAEEIGLIREATPEEMHKWHRTEKSYTIVAPEFDRVKEEVKSRISRMKPIWDSPEDGEGTNQPHHEEKSLVELTKFFTKR